MSALREGPAAPGRRRLLVAALVASLSVNLLLGGLIAGAALRAHRLEPAGAATLAQVLRDADPGARAAARSALEARGPAYRALQRDISEARRRAAEAAQAEPLDPAALRAALADLRAAQDAAAVVGHEALEEVLGAMPRDSRAAFARRFARTPEGRCRGGWPRNAP